MTKALSETILYSGPISVPEAGDPAVAAVIEAATQILTDRTRFLFVEAVGSRLAQSEIYEAETTSDDLWCIVAGPEDDAAIDSIVAAGAGGRILSTADGETWTTRTPDSAYASTFRCGAWSPSLGLYVLAGGNGAIQTSPDGQTWTTRTPAGSYTGTWFGASWSAPLGLFVLVGTDGAIQTSSNGTTWVSRTNPLGALDGWVGVAWDGSRFAAGGFLNGDASQPAFATSVDGVSWVSGTPWTPVDPTPLGGMEIAAGLGLYIVSGASAIYISDDLGASWSNVELTSRYGNPTYIYGLGYENGVFVAYTIDTTASILEIFFSPDGAEWIGTGTIGPAANWGWGAVYALGRWMSATINGSIIRSARGPRV